MNFLITNDDGIDATGLRALQDASAQLGKCIIAAPATEHSNGGHRITETPVRVEQRCPAEYVVHGTPADSARLGILYIAPETNWVLSGINHGANLGCDVYMSGTVAAAREAALCGLPAIAFSHYRDSQLGDFDWSRCTHWTHKVLKHLLAEPLAVGEFWNVNLPHLPIEAQEPEIVQCLPETLPHELIYQVHGDHYQFNGHYQSRGRTIGHDVDLCFSGHIVVTKLSLNCCHS